MSKKWFQKEPLPPITVSLGDLAPGLSSDKDFWSDCVRCMLDYELRDSSTAVRIADELLTARRERFPNL